jgi:hypothetical protein
MRSPDKELTQLMRKAETQGWVIERRRNGHFKWVSPEGHIVFTGGTHSDPRSIKNVIQELRVGGFIHIKKGK